MEFTLALEFTFSSQLHDHYTLCLPGNQLWKSEKYKKLCQKREKRLKDCKKMVDIV